MAPRSASATATVTQGPVTLSLFKFSYCTTASPRSPMQWTHVPDRDNIFAVFDLVRNKTLDGAVLEKKLLKVVRGGVLLVSNVNLHFHSSLTVSSRSKSSLMNYNIKPAWTKRLAIPSNFRILTVLFSYWSRVQRLLFAISCRTDRYESIFVLIIDA